MPEINYVESIPDVYEHDSYADEVYKLYRAGVLTGNDENGTFTPHATIRRCEVATIASRMAAPEMRKGALLSNSGDSICKCGDISTNVASISLDVDETITLPITANGNGIVVSAEYDAYYVDIAWGEWSGNVVPLTVYALEEGRSSLSIYIEEDPDSCLYIDVTTN